MSAQERELRLDTYQLPPVIKVTHDEIKVSLLIALVIHFPEGTSLDTSNPHCSFRSARSQEFRFFCGGRLDQGNSFELQLIHFISV